MRNIQLLSPTPAFTPDSYASPTPLNQPFISFQYDNKMLSELCQDRVAITSFIENDFHQLTPRERSRVFEIISSPSFAKKSGTDLRLMKTRFDPANQYRVKTLFQGKEEVYDCFRFEGRFHIGTQLILKESYITGIARLSNLRGV
jgi:hypothetical protein